MFCPLGDLGRLTGEREMPNQEEKKTVRKGKVANQRKRWKSKKKRCRRGGGGHGPSV